MTLPAKLLVTDETSQVVWGKFGDQMLTGAYQVPTRLLRLFILGFTRIRNDSLAETNYGELQKLVK